MVKVVLDTNVFISSTFWEGDSHKIVQKTLDGKIEVFTSLEILQELERVLRRDFGVPDEIVHRQIALVLEYAIVVQPNLKLSAIKKDPEDNKILECAVSCKANCIVTADKHLLELKEYDGIRIIKPRQFLNEL